MQTTNSSLALAINDLSYAYTHDWTRKKIGVIKNFSLDIQTGESFGFLGHNGAGKTTTIKCILNLIKPATGTITIHGVDAKDPMARRAVGFLPEQPYFYDHLTVLETLEMYATLSGVLSAERKKVVRNVLDRVGLAQRLKTPLRALSKGLTQRVALAQAIVHSPKLLILDEPFSGLDPLGRKEFRDLFVELQKAGTTIFMSSHILSDVEFLCNRASILVHGELKGIYDLRKLPASEADRFEVLIKTDDTTSKLPEKLRSMANEVHYENRFVRLTFRDRTSAEAALRATMDAGLPIESFEFVHGSLEDVFLKLVQSGKSSHQS